MTKKRIDPAAPFGVIYALVSTRNEDNYRYVGKTAYRRNHCLNAHFSEMKKERPLCVYHWMAREIREGFNIKLIVLHITVAHHVDAGTSGNGYSCIETDIGEIVQGNVIFQAHG